MKRPFEKAETDVKHAVSCSLGATYTQFIVSMPCTLPHWE